MRQFTSLFLAAIVAPVTGFAQIVVNDSWVDGGRDNGTDLLDAAWWTSSASTGIEVSVGSLGMVTGTSGRGIHGTFAPQTLAIELEPFDSVISETTRNVYGNESAGGNTAATPRRARRP